MGGFLLTFSLFFHIYFVYVNVNMFFVYGTVY